MKVLHTVSRTPGDGNPDYTFWCPGCKCAHGVRTTGATTWGFNGNMDKPSFTPSIKVEYPRWEPPVTPENIEQWRQAPWKQTKRDHVCHLYVTEGVLNFLPDCTHELAGKSVPMEGF
jgi:hypothetical protein